jgi:hypothetical protein
MALADQYQLAGMIDRALDARRQAQWWLAYSQTLAVVGADPDERHGAP